MSRIQAQDRKARLPMSSAKPSSSYVCTKCGKEHAFPAYVYAHWDMEVIHTCDCGAKHVLLRGVARVQATAAEPDAQVVGRLPRGVSTALRGMTRHQLEDVLDGAYGFSCYDDEDADDLRALVRAGVLRGEISAQSILQRA